MAAILNPISIIYLPDTYNVNSRFGIIAEVWCESTADLPTVEQFDSYHLYAGSTALLPDGSKYGLNGSTWVLQDQSPFSNVYTKTEVDGLLSPITGDITSLDGRLTTVETANSNQDAYLYALIGKSALNYLPDTIWEGATTAGSGYICQDLAISLSSGDYIWKMKRDGNTSTSMSIRDASNNVLYSVTRGAGANDITQPFTISAAAAKISIYAGYSINYSDNMIFKDLT